MTTKTEKPAEDLHPDYDIGFKDGSEYGHDTACDAFTDHGMANVILNALRKAGHTMHMPQDLDVIHAALNGQKALMRKA